MSRYIRLAFTAALLASLGLLVGCGGGGGGPTPLAPIIRPDVTVLATDGSVTVTQQTDTTVTLSGSVPTLQPGSVLVSGAGQGLLRKVVSVASSGTDTVVETAPATLEDVFEQAEISLSKTLGPSDFAVMQPALPGVTIGPAAARDAAGRQSLELEVRLAGVPIYGADGLRVELNGAVRVALGLDLQVQIDWRGVKYLRFVPTVSAQGSVSLTGRATFLERKEKLAHLEGAPITIWVGVPPLVVPVVFVPVLDLYTTLDGHFELGGEFTPQVSLALTAGLEYYRGTGWHVVRQVTAEVNVLSGTLFVEFSAAWTPARTELALLVYGVTGPYQAADTPSLEVTGRLQSSPAGFRLQAGPVFRASVGWKLEIIGIDVGSVEYPQAVEFAVNLIDIFFPFNGELDLDIQ